MNYSTYDIIKNILSCHCGECDIDVIYPRDLNSNKNNCLAVPENIFSRIAYVTCESRGVQNRGKTTFELNERIMQKLNGIYKLECDDGIFDVQVSTKNFIDNGVDDKQRTSTSFTTKIVVQKGN